MAEGWLYMAAVLELFSRRHFGRSMSRAAYKSGWDWRNSVSTKPETARLHPAGSKQVADDLWIQFVMLLWDNCAQWVNSRIRGIRSC
jgi:hypothetical protein